MTREVVYACAKKNKKEKENDIKVFPFLSFYTMSLWPNGTKLFMKGLAIISLEPIHFSNNRRTWENEI